MRQETESHKAACNAEDTLTDHGNGLKDGKVRADGQHHYGSKVRTMPTTLSPSTLRMISPT